jgi:predicted SnoaL-like aldol condensation-catalyzing enzyme
MGHAKASGGYCHPHNVSPLYPKPEGMGFTGLSYKDAKAVATYLADDFVSNNPEVAGKQGMVDFAAWQAENQPKADFVEVFHTIAKGDTVVKHYTYTSDPAKGAESLIADFFRLKDGKIVEYWDVVLPMEQKK